MVMTPTFKGFIGDILSHLLPHCCLICGDRSDQAMQICSCCQNELPKIGHHCYQCGLPLPSPQTICGACLHKPPPFDQTIAPFLYQPPFDHLIGQLKFQQKLHHAKLLAQLLIQEIPQFIDQRPQLMIPVPLHRKRQRQRGYNQALEILRPLAKTLDIPIAINHAHRHRETTEQSKLKARERRKNIRGAFTVDQFGIPDHIALFDDVITTSSTVSELAMTFKHAGVSRVDVWAVTRALPYG